MSLADDYARRHDLALQPLAKALERQVYDYVEDLPRIDRVQARAKGIGRFLAKAAKNENGKPKYDEPLDQIQDQVGVRIVTFYLSDVDAVAEKVERYFRKIESRDVVPESEWEFGYFGRHYIFLTPRDAYPKGVAEALVPRFFELQIKTLFQHAWSEAEHDLGYKPRGRKLSQSDSRLLAFTSAQAWGADKEFDELFRALSEA